MNQGFAEHSWTSSSGYIYPSLAMVARLGINIPKAPVYLPTTYPMIASIPASANSLLSRNIAIPFKVPFTLVSDGPNFGSKLLLALAWEAVSLSSHRTTAP